VQVIAGWRIMGGLQWEALEIAADMTGVEDFELWLYGLTIVRNWLSKPNADEDHTR
jgi:hypothetical protein